MYEYCYDALKLFGDEDIIKRVENIIKEMVMNVMNKLKVYNESGF